MKILTKKHYKNIFKFMIALKVVITLGVLSAGVIKNSTASDAANINNSSGVKSHKTLSVQLSSEHTN